MRALLVLSVASVLFAPDSRGVTWRDEFNGLAGSAPSAKKWVYDLGGGGWGNNERQFYTNSRRNSYLDGRGNLVIKAIRDNEKHVRYTSARLKTLGLFSQAYGRFEARMKLPFGQGIWPAFWMMGDDIKKVDWPQCGEIDIMEHIGREPSAVYGTVHGPDYWGPAGPSKKYEMKSGRFRDEFHVFAVDWEPKRIRWFVDGNLFYTLTPAGIPAGRKWVFNKPFFMLINLAVGGNWPGYPDSTTTFPQSLTVDYVRVYR